MSDNSFFKDQALFIGDRVIEAFNSTGRIQLASDSRSESFDIPFGLSGILLYLLELYRHTKCDKYYIAAKNGVEHLLKTYESRNTAGQSLFTGSMGLVYCLLRFYKATKDDIFLKKASSIAKAAAKDYLNHPYTTNSLLGGRARTALILLTLHFMTKEKWIVESLNLFVHKLLRDANYEKQGLSWPLTSNTVEGVCGLLYGAAGVGYVFLELGSYFSNLSFYLVAQQAFAFEDLVWNSQTSNWSTPKGQIRNLSDYLLHQRKFRDRDPSFFFESPDLISLSDGAAGIGLARLKAYHILRQPVYKDDVDKAFRKIFDSCKDDTLDEINEGRIGHGILCLERYRLLHEERYFALANEIARRYSDQYLKKMVSRLKTDSTGLRAYSLYKGISGLGYFLLQLEDPLDTPSIILLGCAEQVHNGERNQYPFLGLTTSELKKILLQKAFPRTIYILENAAPEQFMRFLSVQMALDEKARFVDFVESVIPTLQQTFSPFLRDMFGLELQILAISQNIKSGALLEIEEIFDAEAADQLCGLSEETFLTLNIKLKESVTIVNTRYNPEIDLDLGFAVELLKEGAYRILLKPTMRRNFNREIRKTCGRAAHFFPKICNKVVEIHLNDFQSLLLSRLADSKSIGQIIRELTEECPAAATAAFQASVVQQIKEYLMAGVLVNCRGG